MSTNNDTDPTFAAAIGETVLLTLAGGEPSDFMQSFPPVQFAMEVRSLIETAQSIVSADETIQNAGYHDNYTDAARARKRFAEGVASLRFIVARINEQSRDYTGSPS